MKNKKIEKDFPEIKLLDKYIEEEMIALAVSGGPDSTAMMLLASLSKKIKKDKVTVVVVDHGLRDGSANEAKLVCDNAKILGFKFKILKWGGVKPNTRIQELARKNRYHLITKWCKTKKINKIFLAHHLDDQMETFLMRLGKGSGVDGLASMDFLSYISNICIVRPFLEIPKERLLEILSSSKLKWINDPSNFNMDFKRSRIREIIPILAEEGIDSNQISHVIKRMRSASKSLNAQTKIIIHKYIHDFKNIAYFLDKKILIEVEDEEILLRVIEKIIMNISGSIYPTRGFKLKNILFWFFSEDNVSAKTLNGVVIRKRKNNFIFYRELNDCDKSSVIKLQNSKYVCWDNRFSLKANMSKNLEVRALGNAGISILKEKKILKRQGYKGVPLSAWKTAPGVWSKKRLISMPTLGYTEKKDLKVYIKIHKNF